MDHLISRKIMTPLSDERKNHDPLLSHPSHSHLTPDTPSIIIPLSRTIQFYILYIWGPVTAQLTSFFLLVSITVYSIISLKSNIGLPYPNIFFSNFHQIFIKALYTPYKSRPCNPPHNPETPVLIHNSWESLNIFIISSLAMTPKQGHFVIKTKPIY